MTKKVAIVHDFLLKIGGAEVLLLNLLKIYPEADVFTLLYSNEGTNRLFKDRKVVSSKLQSLYDRSKKSFKLLLPKFPGAIEQFDFSAYDLVISHSNSFAHGVITSPKTLHVCYCLSPTRYLYDWKNEYLEENNLDSGLKLRAVNKVLSDIRIWDQAAADRPDFYLSISNHVAQRIKKYYRLDSEVVYPGLDINKIPFFSDYRQDYYLIISRLSAYKKIDLAISAFNQNGRNLVIIGSGDDEKRLKSLAKENIEFLGWQSENAKYEYLKNARALIFPGEEDFGFTPIEAMASGTAVIAYNKGGVTETVRNLNDGMFFDKPTADSLIQTVEVFEKNDYDFIPWKLRSRAMKFDFKEFKTNFLIKIDQYEKKHRNIKS